MKSLLSCASWFAFGALALGACDDATSATGLHPDGPPRIIQVRLKETYQDASMFYRSRTVFGFGNHLLANASEVHPVTTATVTGNTLRIIMSELLVGNNLEEIQCRGQVDDDAFDRVPLGTTPDDIADCAGPQDVLPDTCKGDHAVCVGDDPAHPVGVQDTNEDGAADDSRFIRGAVGLKCGSTDIEIDLNASYWTPSGNQQKPAQGGFDALGPAIVLTPTGTLPTNADCTLTVDPSVVDKQGIGVCAADYDGATIGPCEPGDLSKFKFHTEPLRAADPFGGPVTDWIRAQDVVLEFNAPLDPASVATITVKQGGAAFAGFTATLMMNSKVTIHPTDAAGWAASTSYEINVPTTVKDKFGQPLPAAVSFPFSTGVN